MLTGRAKEVVIVRGANFYCYEIEEAAGAVLGVATARVAATSVRDERARCPHNSSAGDGHATGGPPVNKLPN